MTPELDPNRVRMTALFDMEPPKRGTDDRAYVLIGYLVFGLIGMATGYILGVMRCGAWLIKALV